MRYVLIVAAMLLASCSQQFWNEKLATPQERAMADRAIALLAARDVAGLRLVADDALRPQITAELVAQVAQIVPGNSPISLQTVGVDSQTTDGTTRTLKAFSYEIGSGDRWALVEIVLTTSPAPTRLSGFHARPMSGQPSRREAFTLQDKPALNYIWLAAMLLAVGTSIAGVVVAARSPRFRRLRWLWIVGCLFSFVTFSLNWSSGVVTITPISFLLLGAGAFKYGPFAPWAFSFAFPVVAIIILIRARTRDRVVDDLAATFGDDR